MRYFLFSVLTLTLLSAGVWFLIILNINPEDSDILVRATFFASLFLWVSGILCILSYYLRVQFSNKEIIYQHIAPSIRQGLLGAIAICGLLIMQTMRIITWWSAIVFVVIIVLVELFFQSRKT